MPDDADRYQFTAEPGAVRRFREAAFDRHGDRSCPPPTFLGAAPSLAGRRHSLHAMDFDVARAFHGTEDLELFAPVPVDRALHVTEVTRPAPSVRGRRGGLMRRATRTTTFRESGDGEGRVVARVTRTILETAGVQAAAAPLPAARRFDDGLEPPLDPCDAAEHAGGLAFGPLTLTDLVRYAAASADLTAVHFDPLAAAARGYPTPFAMGMLSAAFVGHAVERWWDPQPPYRLLVRFADLVWPGETLVVVPGRSDDAPAVHTMACRSGDRVVTTARLTGADRRRHQAPR